MNRFEELKALILSLEEEFHKFYDKGNKTAGTRVRKGIGHKKPMTLMRCFAATLCQKYVYIR